MWSQAIVFLASFSEISFASEEMRVMNSTQHSMSRSRASFAKATPPWAGRISPTIFWTVAAMCKRMKRDGGQILQSRRGGSYLLATTDHHSL